jgi:3-hydroxyisobutyrate dehydrogenase-like beta-hydroxyacid dehydrogenase
MAHGETPASWAARPGAARTEAVAWNRSGCPTCGPGPGRSPERDFSPSFRPRLAAKDAGLVADAAWQHSSWVICLHAKEEKDAEA